MATRRPRRSASARKLLLDLGADLRGANKQGNTPLHAAAFAGYNSVVQLLVDCGAVLNARNDQGQTPYTIASGIMVTQMFFQHPSTAALLRRLGGIE